MSELHEAVKNNDIETVKELVQAVVQDKRAEFLNSTDEDDITAIEYAVKNDNTLMARLLLENGAHSQEKVRLGDFSSPLEVAVKNNSFKMVKLLVGDRITKSCSIRTLLQAAKHGNCEIAKFLFERGAKLAGMGAGEVLYEAVKRNHTEMVKLLFENGAVVNKAYGTNFIHYAVCHNNQEVADLLLANGASVEDRFKEVLGVGPGSRGFVTFASNGCVDRYLSNNDRAIDAAVKGSNIEMIRYLLGKGAIVVYKGHTVLDKAIERRNLDIIKFLADHAEVNVKLQGLRTAIQSNDPDLLLFMLNNGYHFRMTNIGQHDHPFMEAIRCGSIEMVSILLANNKTIDPAGDSFKQALDQANQLLKRIPNNPNIKEIISLLNQYSKVAVYDFHSQRVMLSAHVAAERGYAEIIKVIKLAGVHINQVNSEVLTPLMVALGLDHIKTAAALIEHGAKVDVEDNNGLTAIEREGQRVIGGKANIKLLLRAGATPKSDKVKNYCRKIIGEALVDSIAEPYDVKGVSKILNIADKLYPDLVESLCQSVINPTAPGGIVSIFKSFSSVEKDDYRLKFHGSSYPALMVNVNTINRMNYKPQKPIEELAADIAKELLEQDAYYKKSHAVLIEKGKQVTVRDIDGFLALRQRRYEYLKYLVSCSLLSTFVSTECVKVIVKEDGRYQEINSNPAIVALDESKDANGYSTIERLVLDRLIYENDIGLADQLAQRYFDNYVDAKSKAFLPMLADKFYHAWKISEDDKDLARAAKAALAIDYDDKTVNKLKTVVLESYLGYKIGDIDDMLKRQAERLQKAENQKAAEQKAGHSEIKPLDAEFTIRVEYNIEDDIIKLLKESHEKPRQAINMLQIIKNTVNPEPEEIYGASASAGSESSDAPEVGSVASLEQALEQKHDDVADDDWVKVSEDDAPKEFITEKGKGRAPRDKQQEAAQDNDKAKSNKGKFWFGR